MTDHPSALVPSPPRDVQAQLDDLLATLDEEQADRPWSAIVPHYQPPADVSDEELRRHALAIEDGVIRDARKWRPGRQSDPLESWGRHPAIGHLLVAFAFCRTLPEAIRLVRTGAVTLDGETVTIAENAKAQRPGTHYLSVGERTVQFLCNLQEG